MISAQLFCSTSVRLSCSCMFKRTESQGKNLLVLEQHLKCKTASPLISTYRVCAAKRSCSGRQPEATSTARVSQAPRSPVLLEPGVYKIMGHLQAPTRCKVQTAYCATTAVNTFSPLPSVSTFGTEKLHVFSRTESVYFQSKACTFLLYF